MLKPTLYLLLVLVYCSAGFRSQAEAQVADARKTLGGTISGKVTVGGKPRAGIVVGLRAADQGSQPAPWLKATSDGDGKYRLGGVAPGRWLVIPMAPAFVVASHSFGSTGKMILVAGDESVEDVDFALVSGGVITGRVTDSGGRPLVEERLNVIPADSPQPGVANADRVESRTTQTDDRGVYRIFGLAAGRYKIAVGQPETSGLVGTTRRAYQQTFYPDTTNPARATLVEVTEGGEASRIDITVGRALQSFTATGQIIDGETGKPVTGRLWGLAKLTDSRDTNFYPHRYASDSKGEFKVEGLLPGRYAVFVHPEQDVPSYSEPVQFQVVDKNIEGLVIKTLAGATLSGRVVIEGIQDKTFLARMGQMRLNLYVSSPAKALPNWHSAAINQDGTFQIRGVQPGNASFNTVSSGDSTLVKNLLIIHTERFGIEQPRGIEINANDQIDGLTVVVAYGTGVVSGDIRYENAILPAGSRVMVKVTRTDKVTPLTATDVDARGHFQIERLPPGNYWLDVDAYVPPGHRRPPSLRQQIEVAGGVTKIKLTLDLNPALQPNPGP